MHKGFFPGYTCKYILFLLMLHLFYQEVEFNHTLVLYIEYLKELSKSLYYYQVYCIFLCMSDCEVQSKRLGVFSSKLNTENRHLGSTYSTVAHQSPI